jgi:hypothetical protein
MWMIGGGGDGLGGGMVEVVAAATVTDMVMEDTVRIDGVVITEAVVPTEAEVVVVPTEAAAAVLAEVEVVVVPTEAAAAVLAEVDDKK